MLQQPGGSGFCLRFFFFFFFLLLILFCLLSDSASLLPIFYGNLTKRSRLTSRDILPFVLPAIRRSNMFVSIAESSRRIPGRRKRGRRVSWSWPLFRERIWSQPMIPVRIISPTLTTITPPIGTSYAGIFLVFSLLLSDFSCSFHACYSFVDHRSSFKYIVTSPSGCNDRRKLYSEDLASKE